MYRSSWSSRRRLDLLSGQPLNWSNNGPRTALSTSAHAVVCKLMTGETFSLEAWPLQQGRSRVKSGRFGRRPLD